MVHELLRRVELPRTARFALARARALWAFRAGSVGRKALVNGRIRVVALGALVVGDFVNFVSGIVPCELIVSPGGSLQIGDRCIFNYGVSIVARRQVVIGSRCMFGSHVRISDVSERGEPLPVVIGDGVWVAHGAVIAAGVRVGDGAVVSAGSVVTRDVPPRMMAIGNPARITSQALTQATEKT